MILIIASSVLSWNLPSGHDNSEKSTGTDNPQKDDPSQPSPNEQPAENPNKSDDNSDKKEPDQPNVENNPAFPKVGGNSNLHSQIESGQKKKAKGKLRSNLRIHN
ncbi:uncharacterized protein VICG_00817 [Vittaforma corneae ATCC 50505]|uniref:Uncharacterized protein n=1 Tax=Vittaforma corneae (strain ATCC 50505) TaxID=993615 RepID=L2GNJ3_VITCO|nr:uncharacterized protein VICG_00817 [Vittaforma corneae ATCC 50505]ELA42174.1 hypothetical protein VICG_00817 [Vittaforma corneae ATCC 50505]